MARVKCSLCGSERGLKIGGRAQIVVCYGCVQDLASAKIVPAGSPSVCVLCGQGEVRRSWFKRRSALLFMHASGTVICGPCVSLARDIFAEEAAGVPR